MSSIIFIDTLLFFYISIRKEMTISDAGARRKILFLTSKVMVSRFRCSVSIKGPLSSINIIYCHNIGLLYQNTKGEDDDDL
jgi:hypothetical protein